MALMLMPVRRSNRITYIAVMKSLIIKLHS
jgi:hypothetical protein